MNFRRTHSFCVQTNLDFLDELLEVPSLTYVLSGGSDGLHPTKQISAKNQNNVFMKYEIIDHIGCSFSRLT